jgi:hypothetical protein
VQLDAELVPGWRPWRTDLQPGWKTVRGKVMSRASGERGRGGIAALHHNQVYAVRSEAHPNGPRVYAALTCWFCRHVQDIHIRPDMPPNQVLRKFAQRGWQVDEHRKKGNICPGPHFKPKEEPVSAPVAKLHQPETIIPMPPMPVLAKIVVSIDENFDKEAGAYIGAMSDKMIADHHGVGFAVVAKIRQDAGYKIKGDPAVIALRNDLEAVRSMVKDLSDKLAKLEAR